MPMPTVAIEPGNAGDRASIAALLEASQLPVDHLDDDDVVTFFVGRVGSAVVGCVGLELYGRNGLLRSLAVDPAYRGRGLSRRLTQAVLQGAAEAGAEDVVVLTNTATELFVHLGFELVRRDMFDKCLLRSWQFQAGVCADAACLRRRL